ncbi:MAG: SMP-30/gluconolactonase/LRE family protein [Pseudomonadota bacterium]
MKKLLMVTLALAALLAGLAVWAYAISPVRPVAWQPPAMVSLAGSYSPNDKLSAAQRISLGLGPEDVTQGPDGRLYTGLLDGRILSFSVGGDAVEIANTGGRPLGLAFDRQGQLIVADADKGLLAIDPAGNVRVLVDAYKGHKLLFVDDLDIAADGAIWFSDASMRFGVHDAMYDFLEASATGRLFRHDPASGATTLMMDELFFANGVALGPQDQYVLVTETGAARIQRLWLRGPQQGQRDVFVDGLPGMPDNLSFNGRDTFWVALPATRGSPLESIADKPWLRRLLGGLPASWLTPPAPQAFVIGLSLDGQPVHNLQWQDGDLHTITSVNEIDGALHLGTIATPYVGILDVPDTAQETE